MEIHFTEYIEDWRTLEYSPYKHYSVTGETEEDCFKQIYTGYIRPSRYCNDRRYKLDDPDQDKRFRYWMVDGVTIEMYYGNGTVD